MTRPLTPAIAKALAGLYDVRTAAAAAKLPADTRAVLTRLIVHARAAARAQTPFAIELDRVALETDRSHTAVALAVADLMAAGWLARDDAGHWRPAVAPKPTPAGRPVTPAPEQS